MVTAAALAGCAATPKHRVAVALIVDGDRARIGEVTPHAVAGLELRPFTVPGPAAPTGGEAPAIVSQARASYVDGDFDACRDALARVDLAALLAVGNRALAARTIAFEAACAYGAQAKAQSEALAVKLASLGLDLPDAALARDAETLLARAIAEVGKAPRHPLAVTGEIGGRLAIDGKPAGCTLPCTIDVPAGDHFVAVETDGFAPASRWVRVPEATTVALPQQPATPAIATAQWRARIGRGLPASDAIGAKLLARIASQPRLVHLTATTTRVTGTFVIDGELRARGERDDAPSLIRELAYDAGVLERPAIWQRPAFWIATSVAVAVIAGVVIYAVYEPDVTTGVGF